MALIVKVLRRSNCHYSEQAESPLLGGRGGTESCDQIQVKLLTVTMQALRSWAPCRTLLLGASVGSTATVAFCINAPAAEQPREPANGVFRVCVTGARCYCPAVLGARCYCSTVLGARC